MVCNVITVRLGRLIIFCDTAGSKAAELQSRYWIQLIWVWGEKEGKDKRQYQTTTLQWEHLISEIIRSWTSGSASA